ncbi:MAG: response regulator transcription factor [Planctomycetales bacterium]|nr:response regulator transcription factor [Planctomycetales bacterium]
MESESGTLILIAEDDPKTAKLIASYLENEAMRTVVAGDGIRAIEYFDLHKPHLVILDVMLPKKNGMDVCAEIRSKSNVPIVFLTARGDEVDKVLGLGLGGDDYISKPFSPRELIARVKAHLRRAKMYEDQREGADSQPSTTLTAGKLTFDTDKRRFTLAGGLLSLTPFEFELLKTLMQAPGRVFLRQELIDKLYPDGELVVDRVIDVHVGKLRQKIGDDPDNPTYIFTVRGIGYRFADRQR